MSKPGTNALLVLVLRLVLQDPTPSHLPICAVGSRIGIPNCIVSCLLPSTRFAGTRQALDRLRPYKQQNQQGVYALQNRYYRWVASVVTRSASGRIGSVEGGRLVPLDSFSSRIRAGVMRYLDSNAVSSEDPARRLSSSIF